LTHDDDEWAQDDFIRRRRRYPGIDVATTSNIPERHVVPRTSILPEGAPIVKFVTARRLTNDSDDASLTARQPTVLVAIYVNSEGRDLRSSPR
jgi:hypothetical protein